MDESPRVYRKREYIGRSSQRFLKGSRWAISYALHLKREYMGESPAIPEHSDSKLSKKVSQ
jgi:hypothetical protein